ncbi:MAG TPA: ABC transporter ATP-binding protein [Acidimicrobiales bacterium]|nr:ABC transporter ATP-binding protein [Acidimicrobiales bacterium]
MHPATGDDVHSSGTAAPAAVSVATADAPALPGTEGHEALIEVRDLKVTIPFRGQDVYAVRGVTFDVHRDSTVVLVGESGSGKSVTARSMLGLLPPATTISGSVKFEGHELVGLSEKQWRQHRATGISIVFQDPTRSLNPTMRIGHQIGEGIRRHFGVSRAAALDRATELLDMVGIGSPKERVRDYPHQLSGGMRQRVMMAIAISCDPKVLIADEPTTALDVTTEAQIMELLLSLQSQLHMGLLLITHNMGLAFTYGDEIAVMYAGRIVESAPKEELVRHVRMPYTNGLLGSLPAVDDLPHSQLAAMQGRPPDAMTTPRGCAFQPRCPIAEARCTEQAPPLAVLDGTHACACWYPL